MNKKILRVAFEYEETPNEKERLQKISEILAGGVYAYLKDNKLLKKDSSRQKQIRGLVEETKKLSQKISEENDASKHLAIS